MTLLEESKGQQSGLAAFAALGAALAAIYLSLAIWTGYHDRPSGAMLLCLAAFGLYAASLVASRRLNGQLALATAVGLGLIFRLILLPELPFLSDDYFRYLWDGVVQLRGINPYRYPPADPALAGIDDALRSQVNHPQVYTIYPPLAQLAFLVIAWSGGGWFGLKMIWLACDIAIGALLYRMVDRERRVQLLTLYWWSPLVVIEVAWNAHLDLLGILPLVAALFWAGRSPPRPILVGLALAGTTLVKYFAVALLPAALRRARPLAVAAAFTIVVTGFYAPHIGAGTQLFAGLATFADVWRFNDGLFRLLTWLAGSPTVAKLVSVAAIAAVVIQSVRNDWTLEKAAFWVIGAILVLSPTVHPWYLLWMVPLLALRPNRAWLYLTGSVFLAYYGLGIYRSDGVWPEPVWQKLLIYGPFLLMLTVEGWRGSWWQVAFRELRRGEPGARSNSG